MDEVWKPGAKRKRTNHERPHLVCAGCHNGHHGLQDFNKNLFSLSSGGSRSDAVGSGFWRGPCAVIQLSQQKDQTQSRSHLALVTNIFTLFYLSFRSTETYGEMLPEEEKADSWCVLETVWEIPAGDLALTLPSLVGITLREKPPATFNRNRAPCGVAPVAQVIPAAPTQHKALAGHILQMTNTTYVSE